MADTIQSPWEPARVKSAEAHCIGGHLILIVSGNKPTPCFEVRIEHVITKAPPPTFLVEWRTTAEACPEVVTPYRKVGVFSLGTCPDKIDVLTAEGTMSVAVKKVALAGEGAAADAAKKAARTATGYSARFSFEEAFENAIEKLPPLFPDELQRFVVIETGALVGGIAGIRQLFVTVRV